MRRLMRRLVTMVVALAIPATLLVTATQPASAYVSDNRVHLKGASLRAVQIMARAVEKNAFNSSFSAMNYGDVDRIFRTYIGGYSKYRVEWKRQFAVGFIQKGGRVNNVSTAERRVLEARRRAIYGSACTVCRDAFGKRPNQVFRNPPTVTCGTGVSKGPITHDPLYDKRFKYSVYLNSCQTDLLINDWETCVYNVGGAAAGAGAVLALIKDAAKKIPYVALVAGFLGAVCWHQANHIRRVQLSTSKKAIIIRSNPDAIMHSNPNGGQYTDYAYYPQ